MPGEGPPACPFIAFEDERDERSSSPDHRHRCFAEVTPAPRALAHQEAYCLSSAFPVCPTFQDWARREAAQARAAGRSPSGTAGIAVAVVADAPDDGVNDQDEDESEDDAAAVGGTPTMSPTCGLRDRRRATRPPAVTRHETGRRRRHGRPVGRREVVRGLRREAARRALSAPAARPEAGPTRMTARPSSSPVARPGRDSRGAAADRLASGQPVTVAPSAAVGLLPPQPRPQRRPCPRPRTTTSPASSHPPGRLPSSSPVLPPPLSRPPTGAYPTTTASGRRPTVSSTRPRNKTASTTVHRGRRGQALRGLPDDQDPDRAARDPPGSRCGSEPWRSPRSCCSSCRTCCTSAVGEVEVPVPARQRARRDPHRDRRADGNAPIACSRRRRRTRSRSSTPPTRSPRSTGSRSISCSRRTRTPSRTRTRSRSGQVIIIPVDRPRRGHRPERRRAVDRELPLGHARRRRTRSRRRRAC